MNIIEKALVFAAEAHRGTFRKGSYIPYIVHPMESAAIAASITDNENVIAAAILHDVLEDTPVSSKDIENEFGKEVLMLVQSDSEDKMTELPPEETWKIRKQKTIDYLSNKAELNEKIIALSDKLSNIRSIYHSNLKMGNELWKMFNQKDKNEHAWYYRSFIDTLSELKGTAAYEEYCELVNKVFK